MSEIPNPASGHFDQSPDNDDAGSLKTFWALGEMLESEGFLYGPDAPTSNADDLMIRTIIRGDGESGILRQRYGQTPLAPDRLVDTIEPYSGVIERTLGELVQNMTERTGLQSPYVDAILNEVLEEHRRRIRSNIRAADRLYQQIQGQTLTNDEANLIWRARTGDATLAETAQLLLRYPIMQSIEAAKYTDPLGANAMINMDIHIYKGLEDFRQASSLRFEAYLPHDTRRHPRYMRALGAENEKMYGLQRMIVGVKENLAEAQSNGMSVQLVRKQTAIALPPWLDLQNVRSNVQEVAGQLVNIQPVATYCYWRLTPQAR